MTCNHGNGGCQHTCEDTENGSICRCHSRYTLQPDRSSCVGKQADTELRRGMQNSEHNAVVKEMLGYTSFFYDWYVIEFWRKRGQYMPVHTHCIYVVLFFVKKSMLRIRWAGGRCTCIKRRWDKNLSPWAVNMVKISLSFQSCLVKIMFPTP